MATYPGFLELYLIKHNFSLCTLKNKSLIYAILKTFPAVMKEAIIYQGLRVKVIDTSPVPVPGPDEIIIKTVVSATNPIDWKSTTKEEEVELHGELHIQGYRNAGKDVAGFVHLIGKILSFINTISFASMAENKIYN
jgi:hypothetical protein